MAAGDASGTHRRLVEDPDSDHARTTAFGNAGAQDPRQSRAGDGLGLSVRGQHGCAREPLRPEGAGGVVPRGGLHLDRSTRRDVRLCSVVVSRRHSLHGDRQRRQHRRGRQRPSCRGPPQSTPRPSQHPDGPDRLRHWHLRRLCGCLAVSARLVTRIGIRCSLRGPIRSMW